MSKLVVYTGPMFAQKTTQLIKTADLLRASNHRFIALKPDVDIRYESYAVISHDDESLAAQSVDPDPTKWDDLHGYEAVLIDEGQFFAEGLVDKVKELMAHNTDVYVAALDTDYKGKDFTHIKELIKHADVVQELRARCEVCNEPAMFTTRKKEKDSGLRLQVGGKDEYEPRCEEHFKKPKKK